MSETVTITIQRTINGPRRLGTVTYKWYCVAVKCVGGRCDSLEKASDSALAHARETGHTLMIDVVETYIINTSDRK